MQALEREVEELRNRSRRNNLVFYNVSEKAEGDDCISLIQNLIASHMGLETLCGQVEIERAHRTPTSPPSDSGKQRPRPIHVAFLRYTDKMKVLTNADARLKDINPLGGKLIVISEDYANKTQEVRKALFQVKRHLKKKLGVDSKVFIAYPAVLKYTDANGRVKIATEKEIERMRDEIEKDKESK